MDRGTTEPSTLIYPSMKMVFSILEHRKIQHTKISYNGQNTAHRFVRTVAASIDSFADYLRQVDQALLLVYTMIIRV